MIIAFQSNDDIEDQILKLCHKLAMRYDIKFLNEGLYNKPLLATYKNGWIVTVYRPQWEPLK